MLPSVVLSKKNRSNSKVLITFSPSPYSKSLTRNSKSRTNTTFHPSSSNILRSPLLNVVDVDRTQMSKRSSMQIPNEIEPSSINKAAELEAEYKRNLESFQNGDSEFLSELEIIDSIYMQITNYMKPFENLLQIFRNKLNQSIYEDLRVKFEKKIEKMKSQNQMLIKKINSISDLNANLAEENKKLGENKSEYERLFKKHPDLLINYQNIVDQMLEQIKIVAEQKKELKKLRKYRDMYEEIKASLDKSIMLEVPRVIEKSISLS